VRPAEGLSGGPPELLEQVDTFFHARHERLKLRRLAADLGELIHYHRPDRPGPKQPMHSYDRLHRRM